MVYHDHLNCGREIGWSGPRSASLNAINNFSNIEQKLVVDIFGSTSISCTITPTIYYLGERVSGLGLISKSSINTNSISWKCQQSTTYTLIMGEIVVGLRRISISYFNINYCFLIARGILAGLLWPRSTSINISSATTRRRVSGKTWPTSMTYAITWGRVASPLRPMSTNFTTSTINWGRVDGRRRNMSTNFLSWRKFHTLLFITFVTVIITAGGRMAGPTRPRS